MPQELITYYTPLQDSDRLTKLDQLAKLNNRLLLKKEEKKQVTKSYTDDIAALVQNIDEIKGLVYYGELKEVKIDVRYDNVEMTRSYTLPDGRVVEESTEDPSLFG